MTTASLLYRRLLSRVSTFIYLVIVSSMLSRSTTRNY